MKYITLFETAEAYNAATLDLPNVSLIEETMSVGYNPYVPETRVVCKYNVTNTSSPTVLRTSYEQNVFKSMEIDGVMLDELVTDYTFDTTGEHTVKYELYDETKLGNQAPVFFNSNLIECIIPNSVTYIGQNVFNSCRGLTSITIPDSVTNIDGSAFNSCSSLTSIVIPDSVITIGSGAFAICSSLTSITIPDSVTSIGNEAFTATDALKVLNYNAKCELSTSFRASWKNLETVIIGDFTPSIGDSALSSCTSLTSVTIGNNVTSIGSDAFGECSSLISIVIPDSVTSIGQSAFYRCTGLTNVTIGNGVTNIDTWAFQNCSGLISIVSNATIAPTIQSSTFNGIKTDGILTVPSGSTGYDTWMSTDDYYLGKYNWTKVEQ